MVATSRYSGHVVKFRLFGHSRFTSLCPEHSDCRVSASHAEPPSKQPPRSNGGRRFLSWAATTGAVYPWLRREPLGGRRDRAMLANHRACEYPLVSALEMPTANDPEYRRFRPARIRGETRRCLEICS